MSTEEDDNDDTANVSILDVEEIDGMRRRRLDRNDRTRCKIDAFGMSARFIANVVLEYVCILRVLCA